MARTSTSWPLHDALRRAREAASDNLEGVSFESWRFSLVNREVVQDLAWLHARHTEAQQDAEAARKAYELWRSIPGWVVVSCAKVADRDLQEHLNERCLTAVQRFTLSLWNEDVRATWTTPVITSEPEFYRLVGIDPARERVVGLIWCYPPEVDEEGAVGLALP